MPRCSSWTSAQTLSNTCWEAHGMLALVTVPLVRFTRSQPLNNEAKMMFFPGRMELLFINCRSELQRQGLRSAHCLSSHQGSCAADIEPGENRHMRSAQNPACTCHARHACRMQV